MNPAGTIKNLSKKSPALTGFFSFAGVLFFWLYLLQLIARLIFVWYKNPDFGWQTFFTTTVHGFPLDVSMVCYEAVSFFLLYLVTILANKTGWLKWNGIMLFLIAFATLLIAFSDAELNKVWGTRNNAQSVSYLHHPAEAMASATGAQTVLYLGSATLISLLFVWLYHKSTRRFVIPNQPALKRRSWYVAGSLPLLFLGIRGGAGTIPISQSRVYFSKHAFENLAAVNGTWNFLYYLVNQKEIVDPEKYHFTREDEAWEQYLPPVPQTITADMSHLQKPNVVVIMLESFSAYASTYFEGKLNCTPFLDSLARTGLTFTNAYSQGDRTDKGLACVIGGWPGQPWQSILTEPDKAARLPSLAKAFEKHGYHTSFHYGGDLAFANMLAYIRNAGFEFVYDGETFPGDIPRSKWGAHDEYLFRAFMDSRKTVQEPFFSTLLTLSSHEPFEVPGKKPAGKGDEFAPYRHAIRYTDQSLRNFFRDAGTQPWFSRTIFVLVADHGRKVGLPGMEFWQPSHFRVPLIFWGPGLQEKLRASKRNHPAGQTDIGTTLLAGLFGEKPSYFPYGRDLLHQDVKMAAWFFSDGFGLLSEDGHVVWGNHPPGIIWKEGKPAMDLLKAGQAMQYRLIQDYKNF